MDDTYQQQLGQQQPVVTIIDESQLLKTEDSPFNKIKQQWEQIRSNFVFLLSPGDKQFKDLPKRVRLMVVSFVVPLLFTVLKLVTIPHLVSKEVDETVYAIILSAIMYVGVYWGVKKQVRREAFFSIMTIPSFFVFSYSIFLFTIMPEAINRVYLWALLIVAIVVFMIINYVLALAINVLNVTLYYTIPLSRLGESVAYMISIITLFLTSYVVTEELLPAIQSGNVTLLVTIGFWALFVTLGVTRYLWLYFLPYQKGIHFFSFALSVVFTVLVGMLAIIVPDSWKAALTMSIISYVIYGQVIHKEQNTLKPMVIVEYLALLMVLLLTLIA